MRNRDRRSQNAFACRQRTGVFTTVSPSRHRVIDGGCINAVAVVAQKSLKLIARTMALNCCTVTQLWAVGHVPVRDPTRADIQAWKTYTKEQILGSQYGRQQKPRDANLRTSSSKWPVVRHAMAENEVSACGSMPTGGRFSCPERSPVLAEFQSVRSICGAQEDRLLINDPDHLFAHEASRKSRRNHFDARAVPWRSAERRVASDNRCIQRFGQGDVHGVVRRDVLPQLPRASQEVDMGVTMEIEVGEIGHSIGRSGM